MQPNMFPKHKPQEQVVIGVTVMMMKNLIKVVASKPSPYRAPGFLLSAFQRLSQSSL